MFCPNGKIYGHKYWELQIDKFEFDRLFEFHCEWSLKGDHCGFELRIEILSLFFQFLIYDNRHWDWDNNCFVEDEERI